MHSDGRLQSDGVRVRRPIRACETTVTPARDEPSEEQAARVPTNAGPARICTLIEVPQVYRAAAPPIVIPKNSHIHGGFLPVLGRASDDTGDMAHFGILSGPAAASCRIFERSWIQS